MEFKSKEEIFVDRQDHELLALFSEAENQKTEAEKLSPAVSRDISVNGFTVEKFNERLGSFLEGAGILLDELSALGSAHPVLAVVIGAFQRVVNLEIARRENNKKVVVVVLQMQSMLGPLLQLRNLGSSHIAKPEIKSYEKGLARIVKVIKEDINECQSDIKHFFDRQFLEKLFFATGYQKKFASHMKTFSKRRAELQTVISQYIALGVTKIDETVNAIDAKIDKIISVLFQNVDTPREKEFQKFVHDNGGAEKCVNDPTLLSKLVTKASESSNTGKVVISDRAELAELQKSLNEALKEDLDVVLEKHYSRFKKVLQVQNDNLQRMSEELAHHGVRMDQEIILLEEIRASLGKTKGVKLKDKEIDHVWSQMNLGTTSVKAKVFVLTFRDYIRTENSTTATPVQHSIPLEDSQWALKYIDAAYVRPIVEAMDEDGSGFISVREANSFALSHDRPEKTMLCDWIAYWAAGWHFNLVKYQRDIHSTLLKMRQAFQIHQTPPLDQKPPLDRKLPSIHVANRTFVDDFLDQGVMRRVEALCRSLKPLPDNHRTDPKLIGVAHEVEILQFKRLESNLKLLGYIIESPSDVMAISGASPRVETWIFPLLSLLLRRYLEVINIAKTVVLDPSEFEAHVTSLKSVFAVFDERKENLEAKFHQLHQNVDDHIYTFAYGMFYAAFKKNEFDTSLNIQLTPNIDTYVDKIEVPGKENGVSVTSILSKPVGPVLNLDELDIFPSSPPPVDHIAHPLEGNWFGWAAWNEKNHKRPHRCVIHPIVDNKLVGKGETFFGAIDFVGTIIPDPESERIKVEFEFTPAKSDWRGQVCEGFYDPIRDVVEGTFVWREAPNVEKNVVKESAKASKTVNGEQTKIESETRGAVPGNNESEVDEYTESAAEEQTSNDEFYRPLSPNTSAKVERAKTPDRRFYLTRNTPYAFRFRALLDGPVDAPEWSAWPLWRKRWAFATEAVLYETRLRMGSWRAVGEALAERRRWLYYTIREDMANPEITPHSADFASLNETEWDPWYKMATTVQPDIAHMWEKTAHYMAQRQTYIVGRRVCGLCNKNIAFCGYQCVVCMKDDLSSSIDFCQNCFDKPEGVLRGISDFEHLSSHSLLRSRDWMHSYEVNNFIPLARLTSEQCKKMFRELEDAKKKAVGHLREIADGKMLQKTEGEKPPICTCCNEEVSLPCWVCVECRSTASRVYICLSCDDKKARIREDEHSDLEHHLLFIHNSDEVKSDKVGKGSNMKRHFDKINTNIDTLYEKVKLMADTIGVDLVLSATPILASTETSTEAHDKKAENTDNKEVELTRVAGNGNSEDGAGSDRVSQSLRDRLTALEANVKNINQTLQDIAQGNQPSLVEKKLDALEEKMDNRFEALLRVVQNFVGGSERAPSTPNGSMMLSD